MGAEGLPGSGPVLSMTARRALAALAIAGVVAATALALLVSPANGYIGQNPYSMRIDGPAGTVPCDQPVTVTATLKDADTGEPVTDQFIHWSVKTSLSDADGVDPKRSGTDASGQASTQVSFGNVSGARKVQAYADEEYPASITITCEAGGATTPTPTAPPTPSAGTRPTSPPTPSATATATPPPTETPMPTPSPSLTSTASPSPSVSPTPSATATPAPSASPAGGNGGSTGDPGMPVLLIAAGGILGAGALVVFGLSRRRPSAPSAKR